MGHQPINPDWTLELQKRLQVMKNALGHFYRLDVFKVAFFKTGKNKRSFGVCRYALSIVSIFWFFQLKMVTCGISTYLSNLVCAPQEGVAPDNAWGPPGGGDRNLKKRENLSVVKQTLPPKSQASREPQEIPGCALVRFPLVGNCPCHTAINI